MYRKERNPEKAQAGGKKKSQAKEEEAEKEAPARAAAPATTSGLQKSTSGADKSAEVVLNFHPDQREFAHKLGRDLQQQGSPVFFYEVKENLDADEQLSIMYAVKDCLLVVVCLSRSYESNCQEQVKYFTESMEKPVIPVTAEPGFAPVGDWVERLRFPRAATAEEIRALLPKAARYEGMQKMRQARYLVRSRFHDN